MFIVFEGIDGCGKTTHMWLLAKHLVGLSKYNHVLITREAYKDREIRKILKQDESKEKAEKLTELFVKDRQEHLDELIKPMLDKKVIVISDRYKYSTICYQAAQGQDMEKLIETHENMFIPDFVFIIDTPVEIAFKRMQEKIIKKEQKLEENKFEENRDFLEKVRQNYLKMPSLFPEEKIIIIDGSKNIEEIFEEIKKFLESSNNI